jgi:uncharacterized metal-binding protein YceD (DUF177 family)
MPRPTLIHQKKKNKEVDPRWDALKGLKEELNK